jgi:ABC-type polysaccharide/polyol phosphate transport system ATPase subunit
VKYVILKTLMVMFLYTELQNVNNGQIKVVQSKMYHRLAFAQLVYCNL